LTLAILLTTAFVLPPLSTIAAVPFVAALRHWRARDRTVAIVIIFGILALSIVLPFIVGTTTYSPVAWVVGLWSVAGPAGALYLIFARYVRGRTAKVVAVTNGPRDIQARRARTWTASPAS
jgi:predicted ferric reductase